MPTTETGVSSATAAGEFDVSLENGESVEVWTYPRLGKGEQVVAFSIDSGDTVESEVFEDGQLLEIDRTNSRMKVNGPGNFRFKKTATAAATAVYYEV